MKSIEYKISNSLCTLELEFPTRQKKKKKKKNLADYIASVSFFPPVSCLEEEKV
jgi:hypothetical protein